MNRLLGGRLFLCTGVSLSTRSAAMRGPPYGRYAARRLNSAPYKNLPSGAALMSLQQLFVFAVATLIACVHPATAELVRFRMTGQITVDFSLGSFPDGIYDGAPIEVELSYDTSTPDSYPADPQRGLYETVVGPSNFLQFHAGPSVVTANDLRLWVGNDIYGYPQVGDGRPIWHWSIK